MEKTYVLLALCEWNPSIFSITKETFDALIVIGLNTTIELPFNLRRHDGYVKSF